MASETESKTHRPSANDNVGKPRFSKAYGFALVTAALFLLSWTVSRAVNTSL